MIYYTIFAWIKSSYEKFRMYGGPYGPFAANCGKSKK